ncbi:MAG: YjgN family protein [Acidobacteria bacterium]|nr:YjgN family protein [Acidobacteriota bacterium]
MEQDPHVGEQGTTAPTSQTDSNSGQVRRLRFHGTGGSLFGIHIVNMLLTGLTLGIYYFWGKVKVRNYVYGQSEFEGDRFAYHGTGKELLIGWLKGAAILAAIYGISFGVLYLLDERSVWRQVLYLLFLLPPLFFGLIPIAIAGAWRYRLSRSSWRNIRFSFRGHTREFMKLYAPGLLLTMITLGFYGPIFSCRIRKFLLDRTWFGNAPFSFHGDGKELLWPYAKAFLLTILTSLSLAGLLRGLVGSALGIPELVVIVFVLIVLTPLGWLPMIWYAARQHRYLWGHTRFGGADFSCSITGGSLFWLKFVNGILLVVTLGFAQPWVLVRTARFMFERISLHGSLDLAVIEQEAREAGATGEGIADLLDTELLDMDLGIL